MHTQSNTKPLMFALLPVKARIAGRRLRLGWFALPEWMQDGLTACAIAFPIWLLLVAVLLVF